MTMLLVRRVLLFLLFLLPPLLLACGSPATAAQPATSPPLPAARAADQSPLPADTSPSASPSPAPDPTAIAIPTPAPPPPQPAYGYVRFAGLAAGTYPVHLHRICSGSQGYHLAYLQSLSVSGGSGQIAVPVGYFGNGWCVIVYGNRALTSVVAYRPI